MSASLKVDGRVSYRGSAAGGTFLAGALEFGVLQDILSGEAFV